MKFKKIGTIATAATLSVGLLATPALAETPLDVYEKPQQLEILIASTETTVSKSELIKKFKDVFPNKYDFLSESDFHLRSGHYPNDNTVRYNLSFHKKISGNRYVYGDITFAGENLEIESLYLDPIDTKDAMFPAKVSKDEAKEIAKKFIEQFTAGKKYKLSEEDDVYYYPGPKQLLTEPVQYSFSFVRTENGITIPDQRISISVLGNGEVTHLYRSEFLSATFDDVNKVINKEEIMKKIKDNLSVQLRYQLDYNYYTGEQKAELVYVPSIKEGIHALTGNWLVGNKFQSNPPENKNVDQLTNQPLSPKYQGMTVEQAKQLAEQILKINSNKVRLTIDSVEETENYYGNEIIYVSYSYEYDRGGYGTNITFDKQTGDLIEYYDIKSDLLAQIGEKPKNQRKITEEQALSKAIGYLKQYAPSKLHHYSKPIEQRLEHYNGLYFFTFPRIVNGIPVIGDELHVAISDTGELINLHVGYHENNEWPAINNAISAEEAKNIIMNSTDVELSYIQPDENPHYALVYSPIYNGNIYSYLDAISGEWKTPSYLQNPEISEEQKVSHPTAEKELNFFIENGYLEIGDIDSFNADAPITKGEVLKGLVKSLTYFYEDYYYNSEEMKKQTYENIGPDHPYFHIVEKAVSMGILDPKNKGFNPDTNITREQLAVWYIRVLGLEEAAKHSEIYKSNVKDVDLVNSHYIGYVSLANSLGLIPAENNLFEPKRPVTYAEFVTSAVRLAQKANDMNLYFD